MVEPVLCYASPVWEYQPYICIERAQVNFCKRLCGLNKNVANFFALLECGRYPLYVNYMSQCIKYWLSLITMDGQRYPKHITLCRLEMGGRLTWCSTVKNILFQNGFGYAWVTNEVGNEKVHVPRNVQTTA